MASTSQEFEEIEQIEVLNESNQSIQATDNATNKQGDKGSCDGKQSLEARNVQIFTKLQSYTSHVNQNPTSHRTVWPSNSQDDFIHKNDDHAKLKMKYYADLKSNVKLSHLEEGDTVLLKNDYKSKRFPPYDPHPYKVVEKKGSMVTARRDSRSVTRNSSFFKPVVKPENEETECPELCVPERSQENPDISEDAECET
ncbi:Hypothetical predicted protein [Paramuricea clavata]|uniref:Uncharacterized protein n=1 Tax=Paramuricea clavata TaxID=317549 RepID=A0A7D9IBC0_PARCT|nr:Hypothetical predicted protein [Paramuricea clavata]